MQTTDTEREISRWQTEKTESRDWINGHSYRTNTTVFIRTSGSPVAPLLSDIKDNTSPLLAVDSHSLLFYVHWFLTVVVLLLSDWKYWHANIKSVLWELIKQIKDVTIPMCSYLNYYFNFACRYCACFHLHRWVRLQNRWHLWCALGKFRKGYGLVEQAWRCTTRTTLRSDIPWVSKRFSLRFRWRFGFFEFIYL